MAERKGFTSVSASEAPEIGVGMLGYGFMGRAHSNAFLKIPHMIYPPPAVPKLMALCGRSEEAVAEAARRFGYQGYYTDWQRMLEDERIQLFDNGGSNDIHEAACVQAAKAGKHILCEKPMARTAQEAKRMWEAAEKAGMKAMVAFNYRFVPAIRLARDLIVSGELGKLYHYRAAYLQDWLMPQFRLAKVWRMRKELAGSGTLGDLGSHIIDLGHFLVGSKIKSVSALQKTFIEERQLEVDGSRIKVEVDDAFAAVVEFENGVLGTLESTRLAGGNKNHNALEINGEKGSIRWNLERLNELQVYWVEEQPGNTRGFHEVLVTGKEHPWINYWWPPGHILGWEHTFVHEIAHLIDCIVNDKPIGPFGATFEDGYRACVVVDAMLESAKTGKQIDCLY